MNDFDFYWSQIIIFFIETLDTWNALSGDRQLSYAFAVLCAISIVLIFIYRMKLKRTKEQLTSSSTHAVMECDNFNVRNTGVGVDFINSQIDQRKYFIEVLEKLITQQTSSNKLLSETVESMLNTFHNTHTETMNSVNQLVYCIEQVYNNDNDEDDDEDDE